MSKGLDQPSDVQIIIGNFGKTAPKLEAFPLKAAAFNSLLDAGLVKIALDARVSGVKLPVEFKTDYHVALEFSVDACFDQFYVDEFRVESLMAFNSGRFLVSIPWQAVFAMCGADEEEATYWHENFPTELREPPPDLPSEPLAKKAPILRLVK